MLTKLLAPKGSTSAKLPTIQILETGSNGVGEVVVDADDDVDWYIDQKPVKDDVLSPTAPKYGFGNLRSGVFTTLQAEFCELIDLKNPDSVPVEDRSLQRRKDEDEKFDDDYYLADLYQNDVIPGILQYKAPWQEPWERLKQGKQKEDVVKFTESEKEKMKNLPNKEYLIEKGDLQPVYLGLVDIVFAYAYNHRVTEGENNVESGWTICKLCATLSWLEVFCSVKDVIVTCFRRSLSYPLFRNWELANKVLEDTACIFSLGRRQLLKCLLEIQTILMDTDQRYILNDLYITDYCVWIQAASEKKLESLARALEEIKIEKRELGFSLDELETAAQIAIEEDQIQHLATTVTSLSIGSGVNEIQKLTSTVSNLVIGSGDNVRDSDDDSSDTQSVDDDSEESTGADDEFSESDEKSAELDDKHSKPDNKAAEFSDEQSKHDDDKNKEIGSFISENDDKTTQLDSEPSKTDNNNKIKEIDSSVSENDDKTTELDSECLKTDKSRDIEGEFSKSVCKRTPIDGKHSDMGNKNQEQDGKGLEADDQLAETGDNKTDGIKEMNKDETAVNIHDDEDNKTEKCFCEPTTVHTSLSTDADLNSGEQRAATAPEDPRLENG
ncbi:protein SHQ1 homolog [Gigantopelta aegis]|uniref:protein SHQ1 homolog n=1 Tax=Gigantopelta aegis TaxID=1735272 RepID=UPI001B8885B3|nr:protein SHQ1 homolog [Gigantopelta aegis]